MGLAHQHGNALFYKPGYYIHGLRELFAVFTAVPIAYF